MFWMYAVNMIMLGFLSWQDIKKKEISLLALLIWYVAAAVYVLVNPPENLGLNLIGMFTGFIISSVGRFLDVIGAGDGLVIGCLGLLMGIKKAGGIVCIALLLVFVFSALYLAAKLLKGGKRPKKIYIPFVPYVTGAFVLYLLIGGETFL